LDLLEIVLICALVWALFTTCVLALLKAAAVADEAVDRDAYPSRATVRQPAQPRSALVPVAHGIKAGHGRRRLYQ
jgi:hypothetical protein